MSRIVPSLLHVVTGLEAIWDKYQETVEEMINDLPVIVEFCNSI